MDDDYPLTVNSFSFEFFVYDEIFVSQATDANVLLVFFFPFSRLNGIFEFSTSSFLTSIFRSSARPSHFLAVGRDRPI